MSLHLGTPRKKIKKGQDGDSPDQEAEDRPRIPSDVR
jgi:hypothetical protein